MLVDSLTWAMFGREFWPVTLVRALNPWVCCACGNVLGHILISIRFPCSNTMFLQICWAIWICKVWLWKRSIFNCGRLFLRRQICWTLLFSSHRNMTQIDQIVLGGIFYTRQGRWTVKFKNNLHAISTKQSGPIRNLHKIQTTSFNLTICSMLAVLIQFWEVSSM